MVDGSPVPNDPIMSLLLQALERRGDRVTFQLVDDLGTEDGKIRIGAVDRDTGTVLLLRSATAGERRSTTAHELVHLTNPELDEQAVEELAAELLIPDLDDADAADVTAIAERMGVDTQLLRSRIQAVHVIDSVPRDVPIPSRAEPRVGRRGRRVAAAGTAATRLTGSPAVIAQPTRIAMDAPIKGGRILTDEDSINLDIDVAHTARIYDYILGGKTNYAADRATGDAALTGFPSAHVCAHACREFMHRATRFGAEQGIVQYLDIGTGIPTEPNLHQIAQSVQPAARVVYVDNDPIVLLHAAALMAGTREGMTTYVRGDAREPDSVLDLAEVAAVLDFSQPVSVSVIGLLHFLSDEQAVALMRALRARLVPGSLIVLSQSTYDQDATGQFRHLNEVYQSSGISTWPRTKTQVIDLYLAGLDIVRPGVVPVHQWRPSGAGATVLADVDPSEICVYGAVAQVISR